MPLTARRCLRMPLVHRLTAVALTAGLAACASPIPAPVAIMPSALVPVDFDHNKARDFARVFCSTLPHFKDADGKAWGDCEKYFEPVVPPQPLGGFTSAYRFLFVTDFGGDCFKDTSAYAGAIAHLRDAHQVAIESFPVAPFGPSEENGTSIARHIDEARAGDPRRVVLIGYGKGASDLLEALRLIDDARARVAALVTIAGNVGGTWVPEDVRAEVQSTQPWMAPGCPGNVQDGLFSFGRDVRQRFLRENPIPVPAYSIAAISSLDATSKALRPAWTHLSRYTAEQDGRYATWETILPGARYLGMARADHWAVAMPFDEAAGGFKSIDRNRYPREALFEALVRFVSADLPGYEAASDKRP